jgi:hypothetical protein
VLTRNRIGFITIIFCLPELNPVNSQTLNYTPVAVGIILFWCIASWLLWARKWFVGPIRQLEQEMVDPAADLDGSDEGKAPHLSVENGDKDKSLLADMKEREKTI